MARNKKVVGGFVERKTSLWVIKRDIHLGNIKYSVARGAVIEHDETTKSLIIDGRVFEGDKDLEILKKYQFVEPFSKDVAKKQSEEGKKEIEDRDKRIASIKKNDNKKLEVVSSDIDSHKTIDISHTKKQKVAKEVKKNKMEIIKGDEDPASRKAIVNDIKPMPIIKDDSLGSLAGNAVSLNKGLIKAKSPEEHAKLREEGLKKAKTGFIDERIEAAKKAAESIESGEFVEETEKIIESKPRKAKKLPPISSEE